MPTTVTSSIGSGGGRTYSTLQAWEDAAPANLVTADQVWRGEAYADSEFVSGSTLVSFGGSTVDSTHYKELTAASGQSFQDQAGVRTNALTYNASLGVALRTTSTYVFPFSTSESYVRLSRLMLSDQGDGQATLTNGTIRDCISKGVGAGSRIAFTGSNAYNVLRILDGTGTTAFFEAFGGAGTFIGCATVRTTNRTATGTGFRTNYGTITMQSCAVFGCTTPYGTNGSHTETNCKNNATDAASGLPGTSNQHSVTYSQTTPFVDASASSTDMRAVASTSLAGNGFLDSTNAPNDISGLVRPANPTIGVWQLASASALTRLLLMGVG